MMHLQFNLFLLPWPCSIEIGTKLNARRRRPLSSSSSLFTLTIRIDQTFIGGAFLARFLVRLETKAFSRNNAKSYVHRDGLVIVRKFLFRNRRTQVQWKEEFHRKNINNRWRGNPSFKENWVLFWSHSEEEWKRWRSWPVMSSQVPLLPKKSVASRLWPNGRRWYWWWSNRLWSTVELSSTTLMMLTELAGLSGFREENYTSEVVNLAFTIDVRILPARTILLDNRSRLEEYGM